ncbi:chemotaxis protein CheX [bacterium]|nr:chemotaxis protein CheX [bacterium]
MPLGEDAPPEAELIELHPRNEVFWASIPLVRPASGGLTVVLSRELAAMLTDQIYGFLEEEPTESMLLDAVAELANVISGQFMNNFLEGSSSFELGVPFKGTSSKDSNVDPGGTAIERLDYAVEGHKLTVLLVGDGLEA